MIAGTWVIVIGGVVAAVLAGLGMAFDATALFILALIVVFGAIGLGVADKTRTRAVGPAVCDDCGGLLSPNAPYCKHCGALREGGA